MLTFGMESQLITHYTSITVLPQCIVVPPVVFIYIAVAHSCPNSIVAHFHSSLHVTTTIHQSYISKCAVGWHWKKKFAEGCPQP